MKSAAPQTGPVAVCTPPSSTITRPSTERGTDKVSGEIAGFWNDGEDKLFAGADSTDGVKLYLYPSKNAPSKYFYGPAWLDASIETGVDAAVSINGSFAANGAWGRV